MKTITNTKFIPKAGDKLIGHYGVKETIKVVGRIIVTDEENNNGYYELKNLYWDAPYNMWRYLPDFALECKARLS